MTSKEQIKKDREIIRQFDHISSFEGLYPSKFADELIEKLIRGETTYEEYTQMVIDYFKE